jgi:hypothetical protein
VSDIPKVTVRRISFDGCMSGLDEIHGHVQASFHDQWDWMNAGFFVEAARAHYAALQAERDHLRELCGCVYQYIGAESGEVRFLDALSAATQGKPFDTEHLLPYTPPDTNQQCNRESIRERALLAYVRTLKVGTDISEAAAIRLAEIVAPLPAPPKGATE